MDERPEITYVTNIPEVTCGMNAFHDDHDVWLNLVATVRTRLEQREGIDKVDIGEHLDEPDMCHAHPE